MKAQKIKKEEIFTGAEFVSNDPEDGIMKIEIRENKVYGICSAFDFERDTVESAISQMEKWNFRFIGS